MNEITALEKFYECAGYNDLQGCLESLKYISVDTLNQQDADGCDMLIRAAVSGNVCAVTALLQDNRCDRTCKENSGRTAGEWVEDLPENSPIRQAFAAAPMQEFIYRDGRAVDCGDIFELIIADELKADKGCFEMLSGDFYRAELVVHGKISRKDFESWISPDELHWEGQIALLTGDEEYGKKFADWNYIRSAAEPGEWLSFLRDLPQYGDQADWEMLIREGSTASWLALVAVRPEFKEKYQERERYQQKMLKKYSAVFQPFNLTEACKHNDIEVVKVHLDRISADALNKNHCCPIPPVSLSELPLAAAVKADAADCIELLLEYGADPDVLCRKNKKSPRKLAADKQDILELFSIYKGE